MVRPELIEFLYRIEGETVQLERIDQSQSRIIENVKRPFWSLRLWLVDSLFVLRLSLSCPFPLMQINFNLEIKFIFFLILRIKEKNMLKKFKISELSQQLY